MKKVLFSSVMACIFMLTTASSCSSDDDDNSSNNDPAPIVNTVTQGTWRVTSFVEDGDDHTNYFNDFDFTFGSNNVLTAVNGSTTYTGFWSVTNDDSDDDSPSNSLDFNIAFASPDNFTEISEDWDILERTSSKIRLRHVSGGDGSVDTLTFEKN